MRRPLVLAALALLLLLPDVASAQHLDAPSRLVTRPPPPTLVVTDGAFQRSLAITDLDIEARIVGHLAETTMTMTFFNSSTRVLAGDLTFPLPAGSTVSGYGLDVDGALVDGVVVEKQEARRIFEAEVRKGVDPGLVEQVAGAAYRTRVFPIPRKGSRIVRVSWISELAMDGSAARYHLPLGFTEPIDSVHLRINVLRGTGASIEGSGIKGLGFKSWENHEIAETSLTNAVLDTPISVLLPDMNRNPVAVERGPDGTVHFAIHHTQRAPSSVKRIAPQRVGVLWDASLSRKDANLTREIDLLRAWAGGLEETTTTVDVVIFADQPLPPVSFALPGQAEALFAHLQSVTYDGGTGMAGLESVASGIPADLFLLFSDGVANLGNTEPPSFRAPVYALNGAIVANHDGLRALALTSGGAWINLATTSDADALDAIGRTPFSFRGAETQGVGEPYPRIAEPVDGVFSFVGVLTEPEATVALRFAGAGAGSRQSSFIIRSSEATEGTLLRRFWAQKKVSDLAVDSKRNQSAIVAVGKEFGIVTRGTSLLVLERLEQYVEYGVRPPASLVAIRKDWDQQMAARAEHKKVLSQQKLDRIVLLWQERVGWWERTFDLSTRKAKPTDAAPRGELTEPDRREGWVGLERLGERRGGGAADDAMETEASAEPLRLEQSGRGGGGGGTRGAANGRAARPAAKRANPSEMSPQSPPPPSISLRAWDPSTPYLKALKTAPEDDWQTIYLRERDVFGTSPAFFLDCSDFFAQRDKPALARRVLSNIVELDLEDPALLRVFARRLTQLEDLDLAIVTFERIVELRPDEPQSHRDLALALASRAASRAEEAPELALSDYQRSLDALARVVMDEWERFAEIELIALVELNDILALARKIGEVRVPVDTRLIQRLDMDIRIVMSWDADSTDMDLHVIEPTGEEAYYGHNRTRIGGRVSRDFTQGYGPEEYSIRKAMKGDYVVRTTFFGSSAANLQGAVTLTLDLYTDYGRETQHHEAITIRLAESKDSFTVGNITFEGSKALKVTK